MDWLDFLLILVRVLLAFVLWLLSTAVLIWGERRLVAKMQVRKGPNRLGPFGMLQTIADGAKLFFKEDITPRAVDKGVYFVAPIVSAVVALITFAVIPFGGTLQFGDRSMPLQVWDPEIGLLWFLAMSSLGVYGVALGGWSSGSKYSLLGGIRSSAQLISYELAMGLSMAAVFVWAGTLQTSQVVAQQAGSFWGVLPAWNILPMSPAFLIFHIAVVAEAQRPPFDLAEAEGELVGGFNTEYSGAKFAMFFLAEFMAVITMSAIIVTLFLGGPSGWRPPFLDTSVPWQANIWALLQFVYFALKVFGFVFIFVWLRGTLPRLTYTRLMDLGWKVMLPIALVWVLLTAFIVTYQQVGITQGFTRTLAVGAGAALVLMLLAPLFRAREPVADEDDGGGGGGTTVPELPQDSGGGRELETV